MANAKEILAGQGHCFRLAVNRATRDRSRGCGECDDLSRAPQRPGIRPGPRGPDGSIGKKRGLICRFASKFC